MGITCNAIRPSAATRMTQAASADLQADAQTKQPEGFDPRDPAHVGEFVAYLASDAAHWISGQVFAVYGDRMHLTKGWHPVGTIEKPGAGWTAEELVAAVPKLAGMAPVPMIEQLRTG
jgi:3-oxoacyl-[acyl-carrier protein] reductase